MISVSKQGDICHDKDQVLRKTGMPLQLTTLPVNGGPGG